MKDNKPPKRNRMAPPKGGAATRQPQRQPRRQATRNDQGDNQRGNLNRIGALWLQEGRNGRFMSGRISIDNGPEIRVLVFKNGYKEESKHPDYIIYEPESPAATADRENQSRGKGRADYDDSDIPF